MAKVDSLSVDYFEAVAISPYSFTRITLEKTVTLAPTKKSASFTDGTSILFKKTLDIFLSYISIELSSGKKNNL
jgi:hypothetical protein